MCVCVCVCVEECVRHLCDRPLAEPGCVASRRHSVGDSRTVIWSPTAGRRVAADGSDSHPSFRSRWEEWRGLIVYGICAGESDRSGWRPSLGSHGQSRLDIPRHRNTYHPIRLDKTLPQNTETDRTEQITELPQNTGTNRTINIKEHRGNLYNRKLVRNNETDWTEYKHHRALSSPSQTTQQSTDHRGRPQQHRPHVPVTPHSKRTDRLAARANSVRKLNKRAATTGYCRTRGGRTKRETSASGVTAAMPLNHFK